MYRSQPSRTKAYSERTFEDYEALADSVGDFGRPPLVQTRAEGEQVLQEEHRMRDIFRRLSCGAL